MDEDVLPCAKDGERALDFHDRLQVRRPKRCRGARHDDTDQAGKLIHRPARRARASSSGNAQGGQREGCEDGDVDRHSEGRHQRQDEQQRVEREESGQQRVGNAHTIGDQRTRDAFEDQPIRQAHEDKARRAKQGFDREGSSRSNVRDQQPAKNREKSQRTKRTRKAADVPGA